MTYIDRQYEDLLRKVLHEGTVKNDRTGTGTTSLFGGELRYDLSKGFPLLTTKKVHFRSVAIELLWFLSGDTNTKFLRENGVTIWDEWADENGDLGPVYGKQWRDWVHFTRDGVEHIDQINEAINTINLNPDSRRIIVNAWNVGELPDMALAPCHAFFQFYVADHKLSLKITQRSADMFLGVPFNIASYALLTHMVAEVTNLDVGDLIWSGGDCHIYANHLEQVTTQLAREPRPFPTLEVAPVLDIDDFVFEDFTVVGYDPNPGIKAPVAV